MLVNLLLVISRLASETYCVPSPMLGVGRGEAETLFFFRCFESWKCFLWMHFYILILSASGRLPHGAAQRLTVNMGGALLQGTSWAVVDSL